MSSPHSCIKRVCFFLLFCFYMRAVSHTKLLSQCLEGIVGRRIGGWYRVGMAQLGKGGRCTRRTRPGGILTMPCENFNNAVTMENADIILTIVTSARINPCVPRFW